MRKNAFFLRCISVVSFFIMFLPSISLMAEVQPLVQKKWQSNCNRIWSDRYFRYGLLSDWQKLHNCENSKDIWWVLELKPKKYMRVSYALQNAQENAFTFAPTFLDDMNSFVNPVYKGPPKWMPPDLAYWDTYIGDWRYNHRHTGADIYDQLSQPELLMLWIRYEDGGINVEATFDYNRLTDFIDLSAFKSISAGISEFLGSESNSNP